MNKRAIKGLSVAAVIISAVAVLSGCNSSSTTPAETGVASTGTVSAVTAPTNSNDDKQPTTELLDGGVTKPGTTISNSKDINKYEADGEGEGVIAPIEEPSALDPFE